MEHGPNSLATKFLEPVTVCIAFAFYRFRLLAKHVRRECLRSSRHSSCPKQQLPGWVTSCTHLPMKFHSCETDWTLRFWLISAYRTLESKYKKIETLNYVGVDIYLKEEAIRRHWLFTTIPRIFHRWHSWPECTSHEKSHKILCISTFFLCMKMGSQGSSNHLANLLLPQILQHAICTGGEHALLKVLFTACGFRQHHLGKLDSAEICLPLFPLQNNIHRNGNIRENDPKIPGFKRHEPKIL